MVDLICSEERCNIHDWDMVVDDEDGERPNGRNPWRGMCLRIDALDRIFTGDRRSVERKLVDHYENLRAGRGYDDVTVDDIRTIVRDEMDKAIGSAAAARRPRPKSGGTPL
jgi:hypothetical protein